MELSEIIKKIQTGADIENWERVGSKQRECHIHYQEKGGNGKFYSRFVDYKSGDDNLSINAEIDKKIEEIAREIMTGEK